MIWDGACLFWFHQETGCCTVLYNFTFSRELTCGRIKKFNYCTETASKHIQSLSKYMVQKIIYIQTWNREEKKEHSSINKQLLQQLLLKLMVCFPVYHPLKCFGLCREPHSYEKNNAFWKFTDIRDAGQTFKRKSDAFVTCNPQQCSRRCVQSLVSRYC